MFDRVSVIVPALNEEQNIGRCIESIRSTKGVNSKIEVIVVDNGSFDGTANISKRLGAITFIMPGINISALRNYGAMKSTGDLLAFVDADCIVSEDWLASAIACMHRESADAVGSFHAVPDEAGWLGKIAELIQSIKIGSQVKYIPSGNMIVLRSSFIEVGGFDETLETNEDVDICNKLLKKGGRLFLDPSIKSVHLGAPGTLKEMFLRELWHGKNTLTIFLKELRGVKNLRIVTYSICNLLLLLGLMVSIITIVFNSQVTWPFWIFTVLIILLNSILTLSNWIEIRNNLLGLFVYNFIYGLARAISISNWIISIFLGSKKSNRL